MLPRDLGGVVDANLRVYGLANVRVADASVVPIALSTHLMSSTYGVAEQASNIIRAYYDPVASVSSVAPSSSSSAFSSQVTSTSVSTQVVKSSGIHDFSTMPLWISLGTVAATVAVFNALSLTRA
jgi:choline dehydrogenase